MCLFYIDLKVNHSFTETYLPEIVNNGIVPLLIKPSKRFEDMTS